jgi:hypothetical protein
MHRNSYSISENTGIRKIRIMKIVKERSKELERTSYYAEFTRLIQIKSNLTLNNFDN